jgi:hypothetical protein
VGRHRQRVGQSGQSATDHQKIRIKIHNGRSVPFYFRSRPSIVPHRFGAANGRSIGSGGVLSHTLPIRLLSA